jgi:hypothetical protein
MVPKWKLARSARRVRCIIVNPGIIIGPDSKNREAANLKLLTDYGITPWEKEHSSQAM